MTSPHRQRTHALARATGATLATEQARSASKVASVAAIAEMQVTAGGQLIYE